MTKLEIFMISVNLQWFVSLVVIACVFLRYRNRPGYIKVLGLYGLTSFTFSTLNNFVTVSSQPNIIINTYVIAEVLVLSLLFYRATLSPKMRKLAITGALVYIIYFISIHLFFQTYLFSAIRVGRDLLMIALSISYFAYLLLKLPEDDLLKFPMFWINSAILFFFSGIFVLSYFRDYIVLVLKDDTAGFWAFRNFFSALYWLVLAYACYLNFRAIRAAEKSG